MASNSFNQKGRNRASSVLVATAIVIASVNISQALAAPFIPDSDDFVAQELSRSVVQLRQAQPLAKELVQGGDDALKEQRRERDPDLIQRAARFLEIAYEQGDARAYGYAQAALQPWWDTEGMPVEVRVMKAMILQHNHSFSEATEELNIALEQSASNAQARLVRAQVQMVLANYSLARRDCQTLAYLTDPVVAANCLAQVDSLTGEARRSFEMLSDLRKRMSSITEPQQAELSITMAVIAHRLGWRKEAEREYRSVLSINPEYGYGLVHYIDFLLEDSRYQDVLDLLEPVPADTLSLALELRLVEAYTKAVAAYDHARRQSLLGATERSESIGSTESTKSTEVLEEKARDSLQNLENSFARISVRGEAEQKEYARYALEILQQPDIALAAAEKNWELQKEPSDALLLLRTAVAADHHGLIREMRDWVQDTGLEDTRLSELLTKGSVR